MFQKQSNIGSISASRAEYFEFAEDLKEENWTKEFNSGGIAKTDKALKDAWISNFKKNQPVNVAQQQFQRLNQPVFFTALPAAIQRMNSEQQQLDKFSKIFDSIADKETWEKEFSKHELEPNQQQEQENEQEQEQELNDETQDDTAKSARILLNSLDLSDRKLAESKFVAYLKELTENDSTINGTFDADSMAYNWEAEFQRNMEAAGLAGDPEDDQWRNLEKAWERYAFTGQGYEQFASKEFARYRYSLEDSLNPFHGLGSDAIKSELPGLKARDLSKYILALEEITRLRPNDAGNWAELGAAQAENELDVQAIAAFYRAVQLDGKLNSAWMGLGAACVNEYCVPDALDAFKTIAMNYLGESMTFNADDLLSSLIAVFRNSSLIPDESIRVGALSVLLNISGEHDEAISLLQNSSMTLANVSVICKSGSNLLSLYV